MVILMEWISGSLKKTNGLNTKARKQKTLKNDEGNKENKILILFQGVVENKT